VSGVQFPPAPLLEKPDDKKSHRVFFNYLLSTFTSMTSNDRIRKYLQVFFFVSIVVMIGYIYFLQSNKSGDGLNNMVPGSGAQQRKDFYPNGTLRAIGMTSGYEKDGKWIYYNQNGEVELIETYQNGKVISAEKQNIP
jgi:antitoxin component YwqK of YwqJK toxin-antitoxin module